MLLLLLGTSACHLMADSTTPDKAPTFAPVYTDGPVPLPGDEPEIAIVAGVDGRPVVVPTITPGAVIAFPAGDARPPKEIYVRRRTTEGEDLGETLTLPVRPPIDKADSNVGFEIPQLPHGIYDIWYAGGRPSKSPPPLVEPPDPTASQWLTIQIKPQLRPVDAVVSGRPGTTVEVAVGVAGGKPTDPTEVTLSGFTSTIRLAPGQSKRVPVGADGLARFKVKIGSDGDVYLAATSETFAPVAIRVVGGPEYPIRDHRLQPGDLLLCQGSGFVSTSIQRLEREQLGPPTSQAVPGCSATRERPWYSHVAVYLDHGETAEMLDSGLLLHSLEQTQKQCTTLDVYRREGITEDEQQRIVASVRAYGYRPYAYGQIAKMAQLATVTGTTSDWKVWIAGFIGGAGLNILAKLKAWFKGEPFVPLYTGPVKGRAAMICSELAAWSYHDADVEFEVAPWWPIMESEGMLGTLNEQMDYTTPNMIARSLDATFQFQSWPAVPPQVVVCSDQIRLGEGLEFDTGSAVIREADEDLLAQLVAVLAADPGIKDISVEGHTDSVGSDEDNIRLSQARAEAVRLWMVEHGVAASRLSSVGHGEAQPLVANDTRANRHRNRRVEFRRAP
ncbi:OmpA family protein [Enhygromyxa salina]|nr:OmpA family protein [Enhygromyxa salina]